MNLLKTKSSGLNTMVGALKTQSFISIKMGPCKSPAADINSQDKRCLNLKSGPKMSWVLILTMSQRHSVISL